MSKTSVSKIILGLCSSMKVANFDIACISTSRLTASPSGSEYEDRSRSYAPWFSFIDSNLILGQLVNVGAWFGWISSKKMYSVESNSSESFTIARYYYRSSTAKSMNITISEFCWSQSVKLAIYRKSNSIFIESPSSSTGAGIGALTSPANALV